MIPEIRAEIDKENLKKKNLENDPETRPEIGDENDQLSARGKDRTRREDHERTIEENMRKIIQGVTAEEEGVEVMKEDTNIIYDIIYLIQVYPRITFFGLR